MNVADGSLRFNVQRFLNCKRSFLQCDLTLVCKVCGMASSSITRWIRMSVLEKCLNLILLLKTKRCVLHWYFGTISVVWSLAQGRSKLGVAANWARERSSAPGRAGVGRQCTDKGTWVFLYAQSLPNHLAFVINVCLKAVSDFSVPFLLFVFRLNLHFPLSVQHPEHLQTLTGKCNC